MTCKDIVVLTDPDFVIPVLQGPRGPAGSGSTYTHVQSSPSDTWTVNHNFGTRPAGISVLSPGGVMVFATITHINLNQFTVSFVEPQVGSVEVV